MKTKIKFIVLGFIIISSIYIVNISTSRYFSEMNSRSDIEVAIPQIELENVTFLDEIMFPGDTKVVEFDVKNYNNTEINEVLMEYYITVNIEDNSIPFTYEIYEVDGTNEIKLSQTVQGSGPVKLNYGQEETKHFKIVFTWNEKDKNVSYADKQFEFRIGVNAEQVI